MIACSVSRKAARLGLVLFCRHTAAISRCEVARLARRTPRKIALAFGDARVSYEELNRRANQLAHHLISYGAGEETRIGIYIERSIEMIVAVLGVLKAGAAYVPLDPAYPAERLAYMAEDAGVRVLLAHSALRDRVCLPSCGATGL